MPATSTLSEMRQTSVRKLLSEGNDPLFIRAVFKAVPERAQHADEAFAFASSFTEAEVFVLKDLRMDELLGSIERRREFAQRAASRRLAIAEQARLQEALPNATEGGDKAPAEAGPKRNKIEGYFLTELIRWMAANNFPMDSIGPCLSEHVTEISPATLSIQFKKGKAGEGIPELDPKFSRYLKGRKKQAKQSV